MSTDVLTFPVKRTAKHKQDQVEAVLADDPNFKFIHDLLTAISELGLPMDGSASEKARELYAKYQRENKFSEWAEAFAEEEQETEK
ncbi:hypothetical protein MNBD_GAMMA21-2468 [hydrothermal vent metagenome]|uniref:Uncharacterized protein n=1 Tax=hydrothermal vent metagenome TaxID=652676 RepID=A0A3B1APP8_9ZZZZ